MCEPLIDLVTYADANTMEYVDFLYQISSKYLKNPESVNWLCATFDDSVPSKPWTKICQYEIPEIEDSPSMKHASLLHKSLKHLKSKYVIIVDADVVLTYPNWGQEIISILTEYDLFGIDFPPDRTRYRDFPSTRLFCYNSETLKEKGAELDFTAKKVINKGRDVTGYGRISNLQDSYIYNKLLRSKFAYDIGWKLPAIAYHKNLTSYTLRCVPRSEEHLPYETPEQKEQFLAMYNRETHKSTAADMAEWHHKGVLFASHKHNGRLKGINDPKHNLWKNRIMLYTKGLV